MNQWTQGYCLTKKPEIENIMRLFYLRKIFLSGGENGEAVSYLYRYLYLCGREGGLYPLYRYIYLSGSEGDCILSLKVSISLWERRGLYPFSIGIYISVPERRGLYPFYMYAELGM
jgi:hypothetical protein